MQESDMGRNNESEAAESAVLIKASECRQVDLVGGKIQEQAEAWAEEVESAGTLA